MGSLFKTQTPAPVPPAPPVTVRDEINRVEQVPVTNADGSTSYITRKLPLTAEEQAKQDELNGIMTEALSEIKKLSATDYADDEGTKRVLDAWQNQQEKLLGKSLSKRAEVEEQQLAKRGLADSSAGLAVRRNRALDEQEAEQNLGLQREELGSNIRGQKLALQQNLYNLSAGQVEAQVAREAQAATRGQSSAVALNTQRQASLLDYYGRSSGETSPFSLFSNALGGGLGRSVGTAVGGSLGGPIGAAAGSVLGSWLFKR